MEAKKHWTNPEECWACSRVRVCLARYQRPCYWSSIHAEWLEGRPPEVGFRTSNERVMRPAFDCPRLDTESATWFTRDVLERVIPECPTCAEKARAFQSPLVVDWHTAVDFAPRIMAEVVIGERRNKGLDRLSRTAYCLYGNQAHKPTPEPFDDLPYRHIFRIVLAPSEHEFEPEEVPVVMGFSRLCAPTLCAVFSLMIGFRRDFPFGMKVSQAYKELVKGNRDFIHSKIMAAQAAVRELPLLNRSPEETREILMFYKPIRWELADLATRFSLGLNRLVEDADAAISDFEEICDTAFLATTM